MSKEAPTKPSTPEPQEPFTFHVGFAFVMIPLAGLALAFNFAMRYEDKTSAMAMAIGAGAWIVFWVLATVIGFIRTAIYAARMKMSGWAEWNEWEAAWEARMHHTIHKMFPLRRDESSN
jgi:hypothetical protein